MNGSINFKNIRQMLLNSYLQLKPIPFDNAWMGMAKDQSWQQMVTCSTMPRVVSQTGQPWPLKSKQVNGCGFQKNRGYCLI